MRLITTLTPSLVRSCMQGHRLQAAIGWVGRPLAPGPCMTSPPSNWSDPASDDGDANALGWSWFPSRFLPIQPSQNSPTAGGIEDWSNLIPKPKIMDPKEMPPPAAINNAMIYIPDTLYNVYYRSGSGKSDGFKISKIRPELKSVQPDQEMAPVWFRRLQPYSMRWYLHQILRITFIIELTFANETCSKFQKSDQNWKPCSRIK